MSGGGGGSSSSEATVLRPGALPAPTLANIGQVRAGIDGELYRDKRDVVDLGDVTAVWESFGDGDDVSALWGAMAGSYIFRGQHDSAVPIQDGIEGNIFVTSGGVFYRHRGAAGGWLHIGAPNDYIGWTTSEEDASHRVTGVGQTTVWGRRMRRSTQYGHLSPIVRPIWENFRTAYRNPVAYWWGTGQTERWPAGYPNGDDGDRRRLRWATALPDEEFNRGEEFFGDIWVPWAQVSTDIDAGDITDDRIVFTLRRGLYRVHCELTAKATGSNDWPRLAIRKVASGDDDVVMADSTQYPFVDTTPTVVPPGGQQNVSILHYNAFTEELTSEGEQFYANFVNAGNGFPTRAFLRIEGLS